MRSGAGLHTAARVRDSGRANAFLRQMRLHAPGAQAWAEYAFAPLPQSGVVFGYGAIDVEEIVARMAALRRALI